MEIKSAASEAKRKYVTEVNTLIGDIKKAVKNGKVSENDQIDLQVRLDTIADLYQEDESIGKSAYKMYYAQAVLHSYSGKLSLANQFLESAEQKNGENFVAGDELRQFFGLSDDGSPTSQAHGSKKKVASSNKRIVNYIVDIGFCYLLMVPVAIITAALDSASPGLFFDPYTGAANLGVYLIAFIVMIHYFVTLEASFGWTIGKLITKTRVISEKGSGRGTWQIYKRSFARFIPFEVFSFIGSNPVGWHDRLSGTRVVDKPKKL